MEVRLGSPFDPELPAEVSEGCVLFALEEKAVTLGSTAKSKGGVEKPFPQSMIVCVLNDLER